jgi:hypothetical protein
MKKIIYMAEPSNFELQDQWFVMAHNLDDPADVEQIAGPFPNRAQADLVAQRLQENLEDHSR